MKNKLFRLGAYCLVLLMITTTLLVGGSFSKFTFSSSDVSGIPSLTVARLTEDDIEVTPMDPTDDMVAKLDLDDDGKYVILYAFTITNNSEVPVTCGLDFLAHIDETSSLDTLNLVNTNILLCVGEEEMVTLGEIPSFKVEKNADINVSTDEEAIFVDKEVTCAIVLDFSSSEMEVLADTLRISQGDNDGERKNAVNLTVKQAKGKEEP